MHCFTNKHICKQTCDFYSYLIIWIWTDGQNRGFSLPYISLWVITCTLAASVVDGMYGRYSEVVE